MLCFRGFCHNRLTPKVQRTWIMFLVVMVELISIGRQDLENLKALPPKSLSIPHPQATPR